ncbi:MAG: thioredoxin family protein [Syntrophobacteraceae bacterium]|nr:thioredoxin family protein [Syntrophobacteraceae bacterium]
MVEKDIARISAGNFSVSIIGLGRLIEEMATTHANKSDEEVRSFMLRELGRHNYIPGGAKDDYAKAFLREFRKFLGRPFTDDVSGGLDVKVLGIGCARCRTLTQMVMGVLEELNLPASVDHVTDIQEIARYNVMGSPALLINGKVVAVGSVPPGDRIRQWLLDAGRPRDGEQ